MGAFKSRAVARETAAAREEQARLQAVADSEAAWKEIDAIAKDVLAGIKATLEAEAVDAKADGYNAWADSIRLDNPPRKGAQLSFELPPPKMMGVVNDSTYSVVVTVNRDGRVIISSYEETRSGDMRSVLESQDLGTIQAWPFPVRIEGYLNMLIETVENRAP
ncbi:hypothetical protein ACOTFF_21640 [Achromobacter xylosoxidans]